MSPRFVITMLLGLALLAFGGACINYTKPSALEHHRAWAEKNTMPAPSDTILIGGVASICAGAGLIGFAISAWRRAVH